MRLNVSDSKCAINDATDKRFCRYNDPKVSETLKSF